ncbi:T9SS type B sorting domain-containing protein [Winogradskyella sp. A3E31]|uniref:T9SS type B sorting domain-containing protein n=1 Tax=Winogradskyella sp. A3E31 TaxID=3349637 RepID=UPI00398BB49C
MKVAVTFLLIFFSGIIHGQKEFTNWYFGFRAGIDFDSENPSVKFDGLMSNGSAPASISDKNGSLLFYTNGQRIWNKNHQVMPNGEGLIGNLLARQTLIVPLPDSDYKYYVFMSSSDEFSSSSSFYYSIIDMSLNGGDGDVLTKNILVTDIPIGLKMAAVQHANNIDFWIVTHGVGNANFYSFLLTPNGLVANPVVSDVGSIHVTGDTVVHGNYETMKISHDANKIAVISKTSLQGFNTFVEVFDFNHLTGIVSGNGIKIDGIFNDSPISDSNGGARDIEFSPNNELLYVSCVNSFVSIEGNRFPSSVYQFDLRLENEEDIITNRSQLYIGRDYVGPMQKGENDKIYICTIRPELSVINNPNGLGNESDYEHRDFSIANGPSDPRYTIALPQDIRQFFYLNILDEPICLGAEYLFSLETSDPLLSVEWDFGDGFTSSELEPTHQYQQPGTYTVTANVEYQYGNVIREIEIIADSTLNFNEEITVCDDAISDGITLFNFEDITGMILNGQTCGEVTYHFSENEAVSNVNALSDNFENNVNPQTLYIRITDEDDPNNFLTAPITLFVESFPVLTTSELIFCPDEQGQYIETVEIYNLFEGNLDCVAISIYNDASDAEHQVNPINDLVLIEAPITDVFIRMESRVLPGSYIIEHLRLKTIDRDLGLQDSYYLCDNEGELTVGTTNEYDSYLWSNEGTGSETVITDTGSYNLKITIDTFHGQCNITKNFTVLSSGLPMEVNLDIVDLSTNNSIEISATGKGSYEYSLDGIHYQDNPYFNELYNSEYIIYIRDKNGCGVYTLDAFLLVQPKFFTPNGDGSNDFWQIKAAANEPDLKVQIFDRYGKSITSFMGSSLGWDGTINGLDLPTNDYWFRIHRPSNGKVYTGHFTLKR